jgi:hypothetical protein
MEMNVIEILIGLALLAFGKKGLGLFLGGIGFFIGLTIATNFTGNASSTVTIIAALAGGAIGFFIAFFIQKIAVVVAGVLGGGYTGYVLAMHYGWGAQGFPWIPVVIGVVVGVALAFFIVKWALILLSSIFGAFLIVHAVHIGGILETIVFIALVIGGILFQGRSGKTGKQQ